MGSVPRRIGRNRAKDSKVPSIGHRANVTDSRFASTRAQKLFYHQRMGSRNLAPRGQDLSSQAPGTVYEKDFIRIIFQKGLPSEVGINGCRVDDVLLAARERLVGYQSGSLSCLENEIALRGVDHALKALAERRQRREEQGVYNTMRVHQTIRTEDEHQDFSATGA